MDNITEIITAKIRGIERDATIKTISFGDDPTEGVVLWQHPGEYIVHRWATHYTDGQPVPSGVMLWSGGYYRTLEEAATDLRERAR